MPKVLPLSSVPTASCLIHTPSLIFLSLNAIFLRSANIKPTVSSATACVTDSGAFTTFIPLLSAAWTSMLSRPTPALAITFNSSAASMTLLVTLGLLLTIIAWKPLMSLASSSSLGSCTSTTSKP
ncbi:MAG: hypothetical protein ACP5HP_01100 [Thermogladius sp.]